MKPESLLGVWTGTAHNTNGWDMKMILSIIQPVKVGTMLGTFEIPMLPCSGIFKVRRIDGETLYLHAENLHGECRRAISDSLELLPDGTLLYTSQGKDWETRGVLEHTG